MRYVLIILAMAGVAAGGFVCPQEVRAAVVDTVTPDAGTVTEIHAAMRELVEQVNRMAPEFASDDTAA